MAVLTLMSTNQFSFTCPIFEVETRMSHCVQLRDKAYYGNDVTPVRRGCQACIKDGKCPASEIVRRISFRRDVSDHYGSATPTKGPIERSVLERVANVVVQDKTLDHYGASPAERTKIATASERINNMLNSAPTKVNTRRASAPASAPARKPTPTTATAIKKAAATGDLAAAINM